MTRVYFNLHKKLFSIQQKIHGRWKVIEHTSSLQMENVTFKVYEAGRQRVLKQKRKNVHAYVIGKIKFNSPSLLGRFEFVSYNPYKADKFKTSDLNDIESASYVEMNVLNGKPVIMAYN